MPVRAPARGVTGMLAAGAVVGGYRIDGALGTGGMSVVYRATDLASDRAVALKVLTSSHGDDPEVRARFAREGRLLAALRHDHIVEVFASGATDDAMFLAMALVEGPTLRELIADGGLDPGRAVAILGQVAAALDAAHATGLVHRDITPGNVLIGPGEHAYLCDFGLSRAPGEVTLTATGQFLGTIAYVAPEQIQSEAATASGDRYALAAVLYECLTGEVPFPRPTAAATLYAQVTAPPPRVSAARPDLPAALDVVIARGLAKDPARRWPCAADLIEAARAALRSRP